MKIKTLLRLGAFDDKQLTFVGSRKTFNFWTNKYTKLVGELEVDKQYLVTLTMKTNDIVVNDVFLNELKLIEEEYSNRFEEKTKITGIILSIDSWDSESKDGDLPFLSNSKRVNKILINDGKTSLIIYSYKKLDLEIGQMYNFTLDLIKTYPYTNTGSIADDEKYWYTGKDSKRYVKSYYSWKIDTVECLNKK